MHAYTHTHTQISPQSPSDPFLSIFPDFTHPLSLLGCHHPHLLRSVTELICLVKRPHPSWMHVDAERSVEWWDWSSAYTQEQQTEVMPLSCCHNGSIHTIHRLHTRLENLFLLQTHTHTHTQTAALPVMRGNSGANININRHNRIHKSSEGDHTPVKLLPIISHTHTSLTVHLLPADLCALTRPLGFMKTHVQNVWRTNTPPPTRLHTLHIHLSE